VLYIIESSDFISSASMLLMTLDQMQGMECSLLYCFHNLLFLMEENIVWSSHNFMGGGLFSCISRRHL
jgi:hypothetical protein